MKAIGKVYSIKGQAKSLCAVARYLKIIKSIIKTEDIWGGWPEPDHQQPPAIYYQQNKVKLFRKGLHIFQKNCSLICNQQ